MSAAVYDMPGLPPGEKVLWRGRPVWWAFAVRAFHLEAVTLYFGLLIAWHFAAAWRSGATPLAAVESGWRLLIPLAGGLLLLSGLAWVFSRTTRYTITDKRVLMQIGAALPMTLNLPLGIVGAAALKSYRDGTGDIPLSLVRDNRVSYLMMWPHVRPWRFARPEPMLRAIPDAAHVAELLTNALAGVAHGVTAAPDRAAATAPSPAAAAAA